LVANNGSSSVSVLLGNGDGTFRAAVNYAVGGHPVAVAVGDFSGTGNTDVVTANPDTNTVSLLRGNGDGTFRAAANYAVGFQPVSLLAADFTGNGILDLAVGNAFTPTGTVTVLLGNGDGTFGAPISYNAGATTGTGPATLAAADFNGDGVLDLAVANPSTGTVSVLLGRGDGTFQAPLSYAIGPGPSALAAGDFNGDGFPDLAATLPGSNGLTVLFNDGVWGPPPRPGGHAAGGPGGAAAADFAAALPTGTPGPDRPTPAAPALGGLQPLEPTALDWLFSTASEERSGVVRFRPRQQLLTRRIDLWADVLPTSAELVLIAFGKGA
jgi:hypothetical protein